MTGTEVASAAPSAVPALIQTPALEIEVSDVALPRIYVGQFMSQAVRDRLVNPGDVFTATGQDDGDPTVLWENGSDEETGPVLYVLGMKRGKSYSEPGGELELYDYDDPAAPEKAWVTYNYWVSMPAVDDQVPFKFLLTRTGAPAAKQMNTVLKKHSISGPPWEVAFRLTSAERKNAKGQFYVARVALVDAVADDVAVAANLAQQIATSATETAPVASGDEPAI